VFLRRRANVYLRFGRPVHEHVLDRARRIAMFTPGMILGRVRWEGNDYGTTLWQLSILQAQAPNQRMQRVEGVQPGAAILLHVAGEQGVQGVLRLIDAIEAQGMDPADVSPEYWRTVQGRLSTRGEVPLYDTDRHASYLSRRSLT
jgi:hypothetical protein